MSAAEGLPWPGKIYARFLAAIPLFHDPVAPHKRKHAPTSSHARRGGSDLADDPRGLSDTAEISPSKRVSTSHAAGNKFNNRRSAPRVRSNPNLNAAFDTHAAPTKRKIPRGKQIENCARCFLPFGSMRT